MNHISKNRQLEFIKDILDSNVSNEEACILIKALISENPTVQMPSINFDLQSKRSMLFKLQILHVQAVESVGEDDREEEEIDKSDQYGLSGMPHQ